MKRINRQYTCLYTGLFGLMAGLAFYLFCRKEGIPYFQRQLSDLVPTIQTSWTGQLTGAFPAFIHPFAFSLIGIGLSSNTRKSRVFICLIFFLLNILFEIGQKYKIIFIKLIPQWFSSIPILENTRDFFLKGTFAVEDVIGITLGSLSAFACAEIISIKKDCNERA
ncbi:MAG: hypothetical protein NTX36_11730 [Proteobacteria bacterium]|nr:hypothetical protein [Pseudomonadota bacterium]